MGKIITVDFRQDTIFAIERDDGVFIAVTPICKSLGISADRQRDRIQRDPILTEGATVVGVPSVGGTQETFCLRLDLVNGWLFTIDHDRVKDEETRQRVLAYKRECYAVLFKHFYGWAGRKAAEQNGEPVDEAWGPKVRVVTETRGTFGTAAAAQMWLKLGLPIVPAMFRASQQIEIDWTAIKNADSAA